MEKEKIREMIVVEGKNDTARLKRFFECDTIETGGLGLDEEKLERISAAAKKRGIIVFTDPDGPGEVIRRTIMERIPDARHVFIEKSLARTDKKVGVEHASREDLWNALKHSVTFMNESPSISWPEFMDCGLIGHAALRDQLCTRLHIGHCNAKTCFKRLNQMGITQKEVMEMMEGLK